MLDIFAHQNKPKNKGLRTVFAVEVFVDVAEVLVGDVGINLGCADVCMAEHGLH